MITGGEGDGGAGGSGGGSGCPSASHSSCIVTPHAIDSPMQIRQQSAEIDTVGTATAPNSSSLSSVLMATPIPPTVATRHAHPAAMTNATHIAIVVPSAQHGSRPGHIRSETDGIAGGASGAGGGAATPGASGGAAKFSAAKLSKVSDIWTRHAITRPMAMMRQRQTQLKTGPPASPVACGGDSHRDDAGAAARRKEADPQPEQDLRVVAALVEARAEAGALWDLERREGANGSVTSDEPSGGGGGDDTMADESDAGGGDTDVSETSEEEAANASNSSAIETRQPIVRPIVSRMHRQAHAETTGPASPLEPTIAMPPQTMMIPMKAQVLTHSAKSVCVVESGSTGPDRGSTARCRPRQTAAPPTARSSRCCCWCRC